MCLHRLWDFIIDLILLLGQTTVVRASGFMKKFQVLLHSEYLWDLRNIFFWRSIFWVWSELFSLRCLRLGNWWNKTFCQDDIYTQIHYSFSFLLCGTKWWKPFVGRTEQINFISLFYPRRKQFFRIVDLMCFLSCVYNLYKFFFFPQWEHAR